MLRNQWRRLRSPSAWAFAMVFGLPMLAEAQQSGLFPLAPVRRERVPCPMEDPVYGMYRHEYFGYFPTCWRKFPAGWGCPTPEAPDPAAAFRERPRDNPQAQQPEQPEEGEPGSEEMPGPDDTAPPEGNQAPPVPRGRSPFELDTTPGARSPGAAPARPGANPRTPPPSDNLFDLPPDEKDAKPATPPAGNGGPAAGLPVLPPNLAPEAEAAPLLALPDPAAPATSTPPQPGGAPAIGAVTNPGPSAFAEPPPARTQAPRRTSFLGGLFGNMGRKRR